MKRALGRICKKIMLTFFACCATLIFVGCENGNINIAPYLSSNLETKENSKLDIGFMMEFTSREEVSGESKESQKEKINEVYKYNETGKIIIVMYHKFAEEEKDEWTRSYENFYNDLLYLYKLGYRSISLSDYINNDIKVPVGCTPIILTFDDGTKGQFNFIRDEKNNLIVNPKSAVGIMESFYKEYPEFGLNGTFYINNTSYFGSVGTKKEKLNYLIEKGFEIGNHTSTHINFSNASSENEIITEVGSVSKEVEELTGYKISSLALPFGSMSKKFEENIIKGIYEGNEYKNKALMLVGASPAVSPNSKDINFFRLPRVRARGGNKEVECDLYWWLQKMEKNPELKYYRLNNEEI